MDPIRDYSSIIHSPSFTFLVGPKHTRLTIQSGLAQHVSKPLHNLMNNGHTRESKHRIAVLEDEDAETFVAFCEYAYTGDYRVPRTPVPQPEHRTGLVESAPSPAQSWRRSYRSESVSSLVPPPAPSPPPETIEATSPTAAAPAEPEPTPVIEEDVFAEAAAEEKDQQEEGNAEPKEADVFHEPQESTVPSQPVIDEEPPAPEIDNDTDLTSWGTSPNVNAKKNKKDAKKKKKKKGEYQAPTEELPVNLTPPSTPPPALPEVDEISPEEALEEPAVEHVSLEPESVEQDEPKPEAEAEAEADAPAEPVPEPALEPEQEPEPEPAPVPENGLEDWGETSNTPPEVPPGNQLGEETSAEATWDEATAEDQNGFNNEAVESPPKPFIDMSFVKQPDSSPHTPGLSLWDEFGALQYTDDSPAATAVPVDACPDDLPYLTFHAKVYVFATRYLIPTLAQLCLRKLHRDLLHLTFADADVKDPGLDPLQLGGLAARQAPMVLDLLRYAYTKTTRLEPISPTSATQLRENELRRLVVHYAACKVKELSRYHSSGDSGRATPAARLLDSQVDRAEDSAPKSLRVLLDLTPELASDLVYRMM